MLEPKTGRLTFRSEGNDSSNSIYYSRKIHWPGNNSTCTASGSGVTIGRGFDLGSRPREDVLQKLTMAGIPKEQAKKIANGAGLTHCSAGTFVRTSREDIGEITETQQLQLFENIYPEYASDSRSFYNRHKKTTAISWDKMDSKIKDVFIDMKYQGRMTPSLVDVFGNNNKEDIINMIKGSKKLSSDEVARNRIGYLSEK